MMIELSEEEIGDLLEAIRDAESELCSGPNFPGANAMVQRWGELRRKLLYLGLKVPSP